MDLHKIKTLIEFVGRSRVLELTVQDGGTTVRIFGNSMQATGPSIDAGKIQQSLNAPKSAAQPLGDNKGSGIVTAPISGLLHRSPSPGAPSFVEAGDRVEPGQGLCIIEAMKVFSTVSAPKGGSVLRILVSDGEEVEAGQSLMEIA
ncbi:biotin/lipoyl-containing protein [Rhizobium sp. BK602]|uniref:acetyl-CoA carboxylase biotin carboxyl carrier protein n=1 Tax=Rhizobium sp. BK602 TaxID=2586986 RepID=UPI00162284BF|nr:biotin/lipoyl-containing protein [Rhizobium sp. BK602]MBB3612689.1 acetyl-CoA carboxylase biotin carboxyl carrier protein [Rhizobium sp. BK602]